MRVRGNSLHDGRPVQVEWSLGESDVDRVEPFLDVLERFDGDGVYMVGSAVVILEHEDHVKVLKTKLHTFQMSDFNVLKRDYHEGWFRELDQAVGGGLTKDVGSERHTVETKLTEWNIDIYVLVLPCLSNLLGESLELAIEVSATSALLLFGLKFFFITISVFSLSVSRLIELDISSFPIELNILGFLLAD